MKGQLLHEDYHLVKEELVILTENEHRRLVRRQVQFTAERKETLPSLRGEGKKSAETSEMSFRSLKTQRRANITQS